MVSYIYFHNSLYTVVNTVFVPILARWLVNLLLEHMRNYSDLLELCNEGELVAVRFLMDNGLLRRRSHCPDGHLWKLHERTPGHIVYMCTHRTEGKPTPCKHQASVREKDTFFKGLRLPFSYILKVAYNFSMRVPPGTATYECSKLLPAEVAANFVRKTKYLNKNTTTQYYLFLRECLAKEYLDMFEGQRLGGPGKLVCIDETFVSTWKYHRGKRTAGMTIIILGLVELDSANRRETGRVILRELKNKSRVSIQESIDRFVEPGSTIYTDSYVSYHYLTEAGYDHWMVNHSDGEFSRNGVSSNAIEGVFKRFKSMFREYRMCTPTNKDYSLLLTEFCWRNKFLRGKDWRSRAFDSVLSAIRHTYPLDRVMN